MDVAAHAAQYQMSLAGALAARNGSAQLATLPANDTTVPASWEVIDQAHREFQALIGELISSKDGRTTGHALDAAQLARAGFHVYGGGTWDDVLGGQGAVLVRECDGWPLVTGMIRGGLFRKEKRGSVATGDLSFFNLNPALTPTALAAHPQERLPVGGEIEVGLVDLDGAHPPAEKLARFRQTYADYAARLGLSKLDKEASAYQVEGQTPPLLTFDQAKAHVEHILRGLARAAMESGLLLAPLSVYPTESDFQITDDPYVRNVGSLMAGMSDALPVYRRRLVELAQAYEITRCPPDPVPLFRSQGFHVHAQLARRSEPLGLLAYVMLLRSASMTAAAAFLKGGPFMDGFCDAERLCLRTHIRSAGITGSWIERAVSPHLDHGGLDTIHALVSQGLANTMARAMLATYHEGYLFAAPHNPTGRLRPDTPGAARHCTLESTAAPMNPHADRLAAAMLDHQFGNLAAELHFRRHGTDLEPLFARPDWRMLFGPLPLPELIENEACTDREASDAVIQTAAGAVSLREFYTRKRAFVKRELSPIVNEAEIDRVYNVFIGALESERAHTIAEFLSEGPRAGKGNWGQLLRQSYVEAGGVVGKKCPDAVTAVVRQVHQALVERYAR